MNAGVNGTAAPGSLLGVTTRELWVRVLNCSPSGCLLETDTRLDLGVIASLRLIIHGDEFCDDVEVVRCQLVEGAGALYQIGVRFLWNASPDRRALRRAVWQWCHGTATES
jgi:PilZ domain